MDIKTHFNSALSTDGQVRTTVIEVGNGHYNDILVVILDNRASTATLVMTHEDGSHQTSVVGVAVDPELALGNAITRTGFRLFNHPELVKLVWICLGR